MNDQAATPMPRPAAGQSLTVTMASKYQIEPEKFISALKATVVPANITNEQLAAFLMVANHYNLNPLLREIYAFPAKGGGIVPIVGVDGWCKIVNEHPQFDGMEFEYDSAGGKPVSVTCVIYRKDRQHPIRVTEFYSECNRATDPWKQYPNRMLRHKALMQGARYTFGFSGIYDNDEGADFSDMPLANATPETLEKTPPRKRTPKSQLDEFASKPKITDVEDESAPADLSDPNAEFTAPDGGDGGDDDVPFGVAMPMADDSPATKAQPVQAKPTPAAGAQAAAKKPAPVVFDD